MLDCAPILGLLTETRTLTLATLDPDGSPRATPLFFAPDDQADLYFLSSPDSPHSRNLARDPRAAVGVYPNEEKWENLRGLQMKGLAAIVPRSGKKKAMAVYKARYPFIGSLAAALALSEIYRFHPRWVRLIDNRQAFGYHAEWSLP